MTNTFPQILLIFLIIIVPFTSSTSLTSTITLQLSPFTKYPQPINIYKHLNNLATTSLSRAHHLKNPKTTTATATATPLSPHSYGGYSISLKFGTPSQTLQFVMDTGSSFTWFPCTHNYVCNKCTFSSKSNVTKIPSFIPRLSSTAKLVGCLNKKCGWINDMDIKSRCTECIATNNSNCTQLCPPYLIIYGSGTTGGLALVDTLELNSHLKIPNFFVGCSIFSSGQPAGIAGFGRGDTSLPRQFGLAKFSYCSLSHKFDDTAVSTSLNLITKNENVKIPGISYTNLLENPKIPSKKSFSEYYYIGLNKILLGGKKVRLNNDLLSPPDPITGSGGTIIDSGTTLTYMSREIFEALAREMDDQVKVYKRAEVIESITGLGRCFNVTGFETVSLPSLEFHFKGGAKMKFPLGNYFSLAGKDDVVCLTIVTDSPGQEIESGPRVILGNTQQQNFYLEYDLRHNKLGFKQHKCG